MDQLKSISEMIEEFLAREEPILVSTLELLKAIYSVAIDEELIALEPLVSKAKEEKVIISCDASIKKNPGGPSAVGIVINYGKQEIKVARPTKSLTNNQAEYDAVYIGLAQFFSIVNNPQSIVEVRSDSLLVVKQLNNEMKCNDKILEKKRDLILELVRELPVEVRFVWRPRNSTPALKKANYLAQDEINVPRH